MSKDQTSTESRLADRAYWDESLYPKAADLASTFGKLALEGYAVAELLPRRDARIVSFLSNSLHSLTVDLLDKFSPGSHDESALETLGSLEPEAKKLRYIQPKSIEKAGGIKNDVWKRFSDKDLSTRLANLLAGSDEQLTVNEAACLLAAENETPESLIKNIKNAFDDGYVMLQLLKKGLVLHETRTVPEAGSRMSVAIYKAQAFGEVPAWQHPEAYWKGEKEPPELRYGMYTDWIIEVFKEFQGRPLSVHDLAKVLYAEEYDSNREKVVARVNALMFRNERVNETLWAAGLKLGRLSTERVNYIALPQDEFENVNPDSLEYLTDDELRNLAIKLRMEEGGKSAPRGWGARNLNMESEPFWEGVDAPEVERRQGMVSDWLIDILLSHPNRDLSYRDIAQIIHAEKFDAWRSNPSYLYQNIKMTFKTSQKIKAKLEAEGLIICPTRLAGSKAYLGVVAIFRNEYDTFVRGETPLLRPLTIEERRLEAVRLRRKEHAYQTELKKRRQIEETWSEREKELRRLHRSQKRQADRASRAWSLDRNNPPVETQLEISGWKAEEEIYERNQPWLYGLQMEEEWDKKQKETDRQRKAADLAIEKWYTAVERAERLSLAQVQKEKRFLRAVGEILFQQDQEDLNSLINKSETNQSPEPVAEETLAPVALPETSGEIKIPKAVSASRQGVWNERTRRVFSWESDLAAETNRAIELLVRAGYPLDTQTKLKLGNNGNLKLMAERGYLSEADVELGELSLDQAVLTLLLNSRATKKLFLDDESEAKALKNVGEDIDRYIRMKAK